MGKTWDEMAASACGRTFIDAKQGISGPMFSVLCIDPGRSTWVVCADLGNGEVFCLHADAFRLGCFEAVA